MRGQHRHALLRRWRENELELRRLAELPVGPIDPAERERQLRSEQSRLEHLLGLDRRPPWRRAEEP